MSDLPPTPARHDLPYAAPAKAWRWRAALWLLIASLLPPLLLVAVLFAPPRVERAIFFGRDRERTSGGLWITVALLSLVSIAAFSFATKRFAVWACLALHLAVLLGTVGPPGCIVIPFLMHW